jgi:hypothetical protein
MYSSERKIYIDGKLLNSLEYMLHLYIKSILDNPTQVKEQDILILLIN